MTKEELEKEAKQSYLDNTYEMQWGAEGDFDYTRGYLAGAEPREKRIADLEKENAELKKDKKELCHSISEGGKACVYLNEQLTKAKDHIKKLLGCLQQDTNDPQTNYYVVKYMTEAEQFLKDSEVEK